MRIATPWDAGTYDRSSEPQQAWASDVLERLADLAKDAALGDGSRPPLGPAGARAASGRTTRSPVRGQGNIARVREVIAAVARDIAPELVGWSPWVFAGPDETERRLRRAGFTATRCRLQERPT